jgi:uncharacterized protein
MLSYPLHAAGKPDQPRTAHFPGIGVPILFVSGTRDSMAGTADLTKAAKAVKGKVSFHWVDTADHGYRPLKASGRTAGDVTAEVADTTVAWVADLAG